MMILLMMMRKEEEKMEAAIQPATAASPDGFTLGLALPVGTHRREGAGYKHKNGNMHDNASNDTQRNRDGGKEEGVQIQSSLSLSTTGSKQRWGEATLRHVRMHAARWEGVGRASDTHPSPCWSFPPRHPWHPPRPLAARAAAPQGSRPCHLFAKARRRRPWQHRRG